MAGDDFPIKKHDSRVRENSEVVIIYPDLYKKKNPSQFGVGLLLLVMNIPVFHELISLQFIHWFI